MLEVIGPKAEGDAPVLARAGAVILIGTALPDVARGAIVAFPATNMAEEDGTFVNLRGRVQRYGQAKAPPGMARPLWWALADLLAFLGEKAAYFTSSDAFAAMAAARPEFAGMSYDALALSGQVVHGSRESAGAAR